MIPVLLGKIKNNNNEIENLLPKVTTLDNGKVLTVINGVWGAANAGGGLAVHCVYDETIQKNVLDKTWQEIYNALVSGKSVCIISGDISDILLIWCDLTVGCDLTLDVPYYYITCDQGSTSFTCASPNEYPEM